MRRLNLLWVLLLGIILVGCSHKLEVKNINQYTSSSFTRIESEPTIGVVSSTNDPYSKRLVRSVVEELDKRLEGIYFPPPENWDNMDVIAKIDITPNYKGSGWNFLINWPGFLIFTPAWNGYVYKVDYDFDITLTRGVDEEGIDSFSIPVKLDVRHADMNRTWTEIGWLEWGVIPLVGGIVFIQYDDNVSQLVLNEAGRPLGEYIAEEIIYRIKSRL